MAGQTKTCVRCGQSKECKRKNFRLLKNGTYDPYCVRCRQKKKRHSSRLVAARQKRCMDKIERQAIERLVESVSWGGSTVPHTAELLESLMQYFGGVNGLAAMYYKQYLDARPGSSFRTKLLDTAVRLVSKNTEIGGAQKPLELMSAEEIEAEIDARIRVAAKIEQSAGRIVDATPQENPAITPAQPIPGCAAADPDGPVDGRLRPLQAHGAPDGAVEQEDRGPGAVSTDGAAG